MNEIDIQDLGGEPVHHKKEFLRYEIDLRSNFAGSLGDDFGVLGTPVQQEL